MEERKYQRWTEEEDVLIFRLLGQKTAILAEVTGRGHNAVLMRKKHLRQNPPKKIHKKWTSIEEKWLLSTPRSIDECASFLKRTRSSIVQRLFLLKYNKRE